MLPELATRRLRAIGIGCAAFAWLLPAHADSACPIVLEPREPSTAWHEKAREAEGVFAKLAERQHDCRSVRIEVQPEGNALLTFTTTDGRIAVRLLHSPSDIPPTLEALLVTLPVETPIEAPSPSTKVSPNPLPSKQPAAHDQPDQPAVSAPARSPHRMFFEAFSGARFGFGAGYFAPALGLRATMQLVRWEIGVRGEWNPLYVPLVDSAPPGYSMYSFQANLFLGRRDVRRFGAFQYGAMMGIAAIQEEADADPATKGKVDIGAFQPRIGGYGGVVIPREGKIRLNIGLFGDFALWGLRAKGTVVKNLPALPRLGLGLTIGMEVAP